LKVASKGNNNRLSVATSRDDLNAQVLNELGALESRYQASEEELRRKISTLGREKE
jgi:hypothetical protein